MITALLQRPWNMNDALKTLLVLFPLVAPTTSLSAGHEPVLNGPGRLPPGRGPFTHQILSASSADGLLWQRDAGVRLEHASVPCAVADGDRILLYFVDADRGANLPESVGCAVSRDGLGFEKQPLAIEGLPTRKALDPCVLKDPAGKFRLYYFGADIGGDPAMQAGDHEIPLALSDDGVRFKEAGVVFRHPQLVDPDVFVFHGTWFMYVFGRGDTLIATSPDGRDFTYKQSLALQDFGTVAPVSLGDGRLRLYAFEQRKPVGNAFVSFVSTNGFDWAREEGVRLRATQTQQITDPFVIPWKGGFKMYFKTEASAAREGGAQGSRPGRPRGTFADEPDRRPGPASGPSDRPGPWDNDVLVFRAPAKGAAQKLATFERAGVPTLARLQDGRILAAYQHFPEDDQRNFDRVAVRFSRDEGRTWTQPQPITVEGMDPGLARPFDPTLVPLPDGRIRLYFTSNRSPDFRRSTPAIYSAISTNGILYAFEPGIRFSIEGRIVIDCAAALHEGVFHLIVPDNGTVSDFETSQQRREPQRGGTGYHATSQDGLRFERVADVQLPTNGRWLGNLQSDGPRLVFFGSGGGGPGRPGGLWRATSADGAAWQLDADLVPVPGADPGAVKLSDGSWLLATTGPPRPGTAGWRPRGPNAPEGTPAE
jgi:hypothetical protein